MSNTLWTGAILSVFCVIGVSTFLAVRPDASAPRYEEVCARTSANLTLMPVPGLGIPLGSGMSLMPTSQCDKTEMQCVWGKDFVGRKECK